MFWPQTGLVLRPTVSDHITATSPSQTEGSQHPQWIFGTLPTTIRMTHSDQIWMTRHIHMIDHALGLAKKLTRMLTRDLFVVANFVV